MTSRKIIPLIRDPRKQKTESYRRPNHPDFMDASELKKIKFSGIRRNQIGLQWEFWILGKIERTVSFTDVAKDSLALTRAHIDLFAMAPEPNVFRR